MRLLFFISIFFVSTFLFSQNKYDYNWLYGYVSDPYSSIENEGILIDFNAVPTDTFIKDIPFDIFTENATMSDEEGNLIFYTNGCEIANRNHEIMMNGDSLNPGEFHNNTCWGGYASSPQSALTLPVPNSPNQYYLFHKANVINGVPGFVVFTNKIHYSLIDMSLDGGLGGVVEKNNVLIEDTLRAGELSAIKHSNGEDWWLINGKLATDSFFTFLATETGVEGPFFQEIGLPDIMDGRGSSAVCFSPDGTKFARYNKRDHLYLYDFDRSTGLLSNFEQIIVDDTISSGGCAFSSNSQFLYVSTGGRLFQFDVTADDVKESQVFIDEYDGFMSPFATNFFHMQLAPDCRIFMNSKNGVDVLHVINHPNQKGLDCDFEQHSFPLPSYHQASMPHFPYYRMDTEFPICDTSLVVSSVDIPVVKRPRIKVFPNPTSDYLMLSFSENTTQKRQVLLVNLLGQPIADFPIATGSPQVELDLVDIPKGIYLLQIVEEGKLIATEKVQIIR